MDRFTEGNVGGGDVLGRFGEGGGGGELTRGERRRARKMRKVVKAMEDGCSVVSACSAVGISTTSFYRWQKEDDCFDEVVEDVRLVKLKEVMDDLWVQAKGQFVIEEVMRGDEVVKKKRFVSGRASASRLLLKGIDGVVPGEARADDGGWSESSRVRWDMDRARAEAAASRAELARVQVDLAKVRLDQAKAVGAGRAAAAAELAEKEAVAEAEDKKFLVLLMGGCDGVTRGGDLSGLSIFGESARSLQAKGADFRVLTRVNEEEPDVLSYRRWHGALVGCVDAETKRKYDRGESVTPTLFGNGACVGSREEPVSWDTGEPLGDGPVVWLEAYDGEGGGEEVPPEERLWVLKKGEKAASPWDNGPASPSDSGESDLAMDGGVVSATDGVGRVEELGADGSFSSDCSEDSVDMRSSDRSELTEVSEVNEIGGGKLGEVSRFEAKIDEEASEVALATDSGDGCSGEEGGMVLSGDSGVVESRLGTAPTTDGMGGSREEGAMLDQEESQVVDGGSGLGEDAGGVASIGDVGCRSGGAGSAATTPDSGGTHGGRESRGGSWLEAQRALDRERDRLSVERVLRAEEARGGKRPKEVRGVYWK